jgi:hypothetical protein
MCSDYTTRLAVLSLTKRVKDPYHLFLDEFKASSEVNRLKASGNNKWFMEAKKAGIEKWNTIDAAVKQVRVVRILFENERFTAFRKGGSAID